MPTVPRRRRRAARVRWPRSSPCLAVPRCPRRSPGDPGGVRSRAAVGLLARESARTSTTPKKLVDLILESSDFSLQMVDAAIDDPLANLGRRRAFQVA